MAKGRNHNHDEHYKKEKLNPKDQAHLKKVGLIFFLKNLREKKRNKTKFKEE